jgi:membrane-bound ClpP family serine protease
MDVIAAVGYIDPNTPVEVIEVSGNRIVVRKIDSPTQASSGV